MLFYILLGIIFSLSIINFFKSTNLIIMLISIELMLNSLNILLAKIALTTNSQDTILWIMTIITIAAAEVGLGLAIIIFSYKNFNKTNSNDFIKIKESFKWMKPLYWDL